MEIRFDGRSAARKERKKLEGGENEMNCSEILDFQSNPK